MRSETIPAVTPQRGLLAWINSPGGTRLILAAMALSLLLFYRASFQLPITALGLGLFGLLALLRPDLALVFVPLSVPLYLMPKGIWDARFGIRPEGLRFPVHEVVLLLTLAASALDLLRRLLLQPRELQRRLRAGLGSLRSDVTLLIPLGLFLLAGTLGLLVAGPEGRSEALREWRWLIIEPLIFLALARYWIWLAGDAPPQQNPVARRLLFGLLLGGALVGLLGILQFVGLNLVPLIGQKTGFSDDRILVEGVQRVSSVYGHPNNLGLFLGRTWLLAAVLFWTQLNTQRLAWRQWREQLSNPLMLFLLVTALLGLGGLLVSFSKGAYLGALVALLCLALVLRLRWLLALTLAIAGLALLAGLLLGLERLNPLGDSSAIRLSTWASALAMIRDHPVLGIGLDQFLRLYPQYIDPVLANTNEIYTSHPHNLLLDLWLRLGLLGLLAMGWLSWRLISPLRHTARLRSRPLELAIAIASIAALTHGLVDQYYFVPDLAFSFWLFQALREPETAYVR